MFARRIAVLAVAILTLATIVIAPVQPAAANGVAPPVPVDELVDSLDDLLQRIDGELADSVETVGNVPLAGDDLDEALAPISEALTEARTFLTTWLVPAVEHGNEGGSSRAEQFVEGSLWVLFGPDDALEHPDLDNDVRDALEDAEVPGLGLDLLQSADGGPAGPDDVAFIFGPTPAGDGLSIEVRMHIGQQKNIMVPATFDLGLSVDNLDLGPSGADVVSNIPNFGVDLKLSKGLSVDLDWNATLHAGVEIPLSARSSAIGPFFGADTGIEASAEITIARSVGETSGFSGLVALGLLQAEFSDGVSREDGGETERSSLKLTAKAGLDGADRIPVSMLGPDSLAVELSLDGALRLQVNAGAGHLTDAINSAIDAGQFAVGLPSINFSIIADPSISLTVGDSDGERRKVEATMDGIRLENLEIDTRDYVRSVVLPMARGTALLMKPVNEALGLDPANISASEGLLNEPLPVVSDLADSPVTLRTVGLDEEFKDVIKVLTSITDFPAQVDEYLNSAAFEDDLGENGLLPLPCLNVVLKKESPFFVGKTRVPVPCIVTDGIEKLEDFDPEISVDISIQPSVFSLDLLSPESAYNLLLGKPVDIVSIGLPEIEAKASASPKLDLEIISIDASVEAHAEVALRLVYDSSGIEALLDQVLAGQPVDPGVLADGFYLKTRSGPCATAAELAKPFEDRAHGCEIGIGAGVGGRLQLGPDEANVWGEIRIKGDLGFSVTDPNDDEQLRGHELAALTDGWENPENLFCLFDLRGAGSVYLAAGSTDFLTGTHSVSFPNLSGDFSLLDLLSDEFNICDGLNKPVLTPFEPVLAHSSTSTAGRTLVVHTGPFAALRRMDDRTDEQSLTVKVSPVGSPGGNKVTVFVKTQISGPNDTLIPWELTQTFDGPFDAVVVPGGLADDTIEVTIPVAASIDAGPGDDTVVTSSGRDNVKGGPGLDDITTGDGPDTITTGPGGGNVDSGPGDDIVRGGPDSDSIRTGGGKDLVFGGGDDDEIITGDDDDTVRGQGGDDEIDLGSGDDTADGGPGDDGITGGPGDDDIQGGPGNDEVRAGSGDDIIETGSGNDDVSGDGTPGGSVGCATLPLEQNGTPGDDDISTGSGNDIVRPGGGNDTVDTGTGDDCVVSISGADKVVFGVVPDPTFGDTFKIYNAETLRSQSDNPFGLLLTRRGSSERVEADGINRLELLGSTTPLISELHYPTTVDAVGSGAVDGLAINELNYPLTVVGTLALELRPTMASNGPVRVGPVAGSPDRLEVIGLGDASINAEADSPIKFVGTAGPDKLQVVGGTSVSAETGAGADQVTIAMEALVPVRTTVDGGDDEDTIIIDLGGNGIDDLFPIPSERTIFGDVENVEVRSAAISRFGWDDGVLTAGPDGTPLLNLGSATSVLLPPQLDAVDIDASDGTDGGRSIELLDDTATVGGARSVPAFAPLLSGDQVLVLRAGGTLEVFTAGPEATLLAASVVPTGPGGFNGSATFALATNAINPDELDELVIGDTSNRLSSFSYAAHGPSLIASLDAETLKPGFTWRDGTSTANGSGVPNLVLLMTGDGTCKTVTGLYGFSRVNDCPTDVAASGLPLDRWQVVPSGFLGAEFGLHNPGGELLLVNLPAGNDSLRLEERFNDPLRLAGPITAIECSHGQRFGGEIGNDLTRVKENDDLLRSLIHRTRSTISTADTVDLVSIEPIDGTNVLATLSNGEVHLDLDWCREGAVFGRTVDTGIRVGPGDLVFAGRVLNEFNAPSGPLSPANTTVMPVTIEAPTAGAFQLSTGGTVDTLSVGQTTADVELDSGDGGDLVNLDLDLTDQQRLVANTGPGNDQLGIRLGGQAGLVTINTGRGSDRVDVFDGPTAPTLSISGDDQSDLLRVHPQGRGLTFTGGANPTIPGIPAGTATIADRAPFVYAAFEQVLVNAGPIADLAAPKTAVEGSPTEVSATESRSPDGLGLTYSWDLDGDGVFGDGIFDGSPEEASSLTLPMSDDGKLRIAVRVTDSQGRSGDASAVIDVAVAPPTVAIASGTERGYAGFSSFLTVIETSNPGDDTTSGITVDWGDGTAPERSSPGTLAHTYQQPGRYIITVRSVSDEDGDFVVEGETQTTNIDRVPGLADGSETEIEGSQYLLSLESQEGPPVERWEVDWGDGQRETVLPSPDGDADVIHLFDGRSVAEISVVAVFDIGDGAILEVPIPAPTVTVFNEPPTFLGFVPITDEEGPISVFLASEDPGDDRIATWRISWGDGTTTEVPGSRTPSDPQEVTHRYEPGTYQVMVTAIDDDGAHRLIDQELVVTNIVPLIQSIAAGDTVGNGLTEGGAVPIVVEVLDVDPSQLRYEFTSPDALMPRVMTLQPKAGFVFADNGPKTVTVVITDQHGGSVTETLEFNVENAPPRASLRLKGTTGRILEGTEAKVEIRVIDRGDDHAQTATLDWGDGSDPEQIGIDEGGRAIARHTYPDGTATIRRPEPVDGVLMLDGVEVTDESAFVVDGMPVTITLIDVTDEDGTYPIGDTLETEVVDVAPIADVTVETIPAAGGGGGGGGLGQHRLTVKSIVDPGQDTIIAHKIDWGDGTADLTNSERLEGRPANGTTFSHPAGPDVGPILVTLIDEDGTHIAATIAVAEFVEPQAVTRRIEVEARGHTGVEQMVVTAGEARQQFTVGTSFKAYVLELGKVGLNPLGTVGVAFVNDFYRRGVIDRNLVVDHITVVDVAANGTETATVYETEHPSVFSTGSWVSPFGCGGKFALRETLNCNGEFRYLTGGSPPPPLPPGTVTVKVLAKGDTGEEKMTVTVGGVSKSFDVTTNSAFYTVEVPWSLDLDEVEVRFTNDFYRRGVKDRNLTVDRIEVNGTRYETEDSTVFSTGSWSASSACGAKYARSQRLNCKGEFTYEIKPPTAAD